MLTRTWKLIRATVDGFIEDEAMTRGAAIACYTLFSLAPLLVVVIAMAGLVFGEDLVEDAVTNQLGILVGSAGADAIAAIVGGAGAARSGQIASLIGGAILLVTASGVFSELQSALNVIWRAEPQPTTVSYLLRARALSVGLVGATGFLLLASLLASAALAAVSTWAGERLPGLPLLLRAANAGVTFVITTALFAAIYKILPDRRLHWRDVLVGALVTAFLFTLGKTLIGWYLGASGAAMTYGAAGALVVVLLWVYYSAQVFLLGAEFTRAWAGLQRVVARESAPEPPPATGRSRRAPRRPRAGR